MKHTPNAENGMKLLTAHNSKILETLADQADVAAARLEEDRVASMAAIRQRHENELKSAKRNFKHRKKKIADRMAKFEAMSPTELANYFPQGVVGKGALMSFQTQLVKADFGDLERRIMTTMMLPSLKMDKSETFRRMYGGRPDMVFDVKA